MREQAVTLVDLSAIFFAGGGPYLIAALFVVMWFLGGPNKKNALVEAIEAGIVGLTINQVIGLFYFHLRPYMMGLCTPLFPHGPETSLPSDHATLGFAVAFNLLAARRWAAWGTVLLAIAIVIAWARVYCGIHFLFDVAGSVLVGMGAAGYWSGCLLSLLGLLTRK